MRAPGISLPCISQLALRLAASVQGEGTWRADTFTAEQSRMCLLSCFPS